MKIYIVDNYDSFTYNLVHYFETLVQEVVVQRNDEIDWLQLDQADCIVLSPGPGLPSETVNLFEVIRRYQGKKPLLGVCLGMQAIGEVNGAELVNQQYVKHGKQEQISVNSHDGLFKDLPEHFKVGLYHSWEIKANTLPDNIMRTSFSENNVLMSIECESQCLYGVQFHPESILSEYGSEILQNFINQSKVWKV